MAKTKTSNVLRSFTVGGYTYLHTMVYCNKPKCSKCPHGPYWYVTIKFRDGRTVHKYIGKSLPEGVDNAGTSNEANK